jgi:hypothetical protein
VSEEEFAATGRCLCGAVRFAIREKLPPVGFCHCSQCRRASGVASNAILNVRNDRFVWLSGQDNLQSWSTPTGWTNVFCKTCGSPAPHPVPGGQRMFVPAGALDGDPDLKIAGHIFVGSKPRWAVIGDDAPQFEEHAPRD